MMPRRLVLGTFTLVLLALMVAGCSLTGESIRTRIEKFISAVNDSDLEAIKDSLDPAASAYNTASTVIFWNAYFPQRPYRISNYYESGDTATVHFKGADDSELIYVFEMTEQRGTLLEGKSYKIRRVANTSGAVIFE